MKSKSIVALALLFIMSFSLLHEFTFAYLDDDHCTTAEYVAELEGPIEKGDICDIHYEYHNTYILPQVNTAFNALQISYSQISRSDSYLFKTYSKTIKPPIT
ncbi:hypothetical protein N9A28_02510 [Sulfurimonas sp.]|nr:hypothetical protein [Sulfurimonas sp.]